MANFSRHWGAGRWRHFLQIKVADVDGDSSFHWGKTLGPSKPVFWGGKFFRPEVLQHYEAAIHGSSFSQFHCVRLRHPFHKSFTGKRAAPNKCSGPWRSDASSGSESTKNPSHQLLGCAKSSSEINHRSLGSLWPKREPRSPVITWSPQVNAMTASMRLSVSLMCIEGLKCWRAAVDCVSFHCVPQGLSISCLTSNCVNTFYHLCNCRGLPWRGSFKMTGKRKVGGRCCAGSSLRAPAEAEHLVAIEN